MAGVTPAAAAAILAAIGLCALVMTGCRTVVRPTAGGVTRAFGTAAEVGPSTEGPETPRQLKWLLFDAFDRGEYARALGVAQRILGMQPTDAETRCVMAATLALTDNRPAAVAELRRALDDGLNSAGRLTSAPFHRLSDDENFRLLLRSYDVVLREERSPSLATIEQILEEPRFHQFIPRLLPRHRSAALTERTLGLLGDPDTRIQRAALVSLVHQNANQAATRTRVASLLGSPSPEIRAGAAEYFVWHGTQAERARISAAVAVEGDPFALAAERAALRLIAERNQWAGLPDAPGMEGRPVPTASCQSAMAALKADPTPAGLRRAGEFYRGGWAVDPVLVFRGMNVDPRAVAEQQACMGLALAIFRFGSLPAESTSSGEEATSFMPPVRDYFDPFRRDFGVFTGAKGAFRGSVHVGDDVAEDDDNGTVVAIANGIVRRVSHTYSWGFIVIVEHRLPARGGTYCSLYAHLAPSISVAIGQAVRKGERIGAVGRSSTWENGGYISHLHFGIHRGPFLQFRGDSAGAASAQGDPIGTPDLAWGAKWVSGYVTPGRWADDRGGWVEPQAFIRQREPSHR